ncbi:MAG: hypothetical protein HW413_2760 [Thermoleophilia bacterium]|nr:hypothetical protein [Thermoleophilia bacterium]
MRPPARARRLNEPVNLGRNDPCYCGSGKKYKHCHLDSDRDAALLLQEIGPEVREMMARIESVPRRLRDEYGIYISYVHPVQWQGRKAWAIGSRVYPDRPPNETFHEFLLHVLRGALGEEWRAAQAALPEDDQHFVFRSFEKDAEWKRVMMTPENVVGEGQWAADPSGWSQYLLSLAWDVASLVHTSNLPDALVARLRDPVEYQGARYEIAIAAVLARLDCEIRFLDEDEELRGARHVEFIATHRASGQEVAVETKSRRRPGVLNEEGEPDPENLLRGDPRAVRRRFLEALAQAPDDVPLLIFIDINAPLEPEAEGLDKQWIQDIRRWMERLPTGTAAAPEAFNALFVTNFAPHYDGDDLARAGDVLLVKPLHVRTPLAFDFTGMLRVALDNYHRVPEFGEDGQLRE